MSARILGVIATLIAGGAQAQSEILPEFYLGTVRAADMHGLSYGARGCIAEVLQDIDREQTAKAGEVLIQLDAETSDLAVLTAEVRVRDLEAAVAAADLALEAARADDRRRQQERDFVAKEFQRNQTLFRRGLINETTLEGVESRMMSADFTAERAAEAIATAQSARDRAAIALEIGKLDLQQARIAHDKLTIVAPFDGVLVGFEASAGDCVQEGARAAQIYAPSQKAVDIHVLIGHLAPNTDDGVALGDMVSINRFVGPACGGTVTQISTEADLETQYVKATIEVDEACAPDLLLNEAVEVAKIADAS